MLPDTPRPTPPAVTADGPALGDTWVQRVAEPNLADLGHVAAPAQALVTLAAEVYAQTMPFGLPVADVPCRVLVVSADAEERLLLRACLALARLVWVDEASTSTQARAALTAQAHALVFINLDSPVVDGWQLAKEVGHMRPQALVLATSNGLTGATTRRWAMWPALNAWWQRRMAKQAGFTDLLHKPLHSSVVAVWAKAALKISKKAANYSIKSSDRG